MGKKDFKDGMRSGMERDTLTEWFRIENDRKADSGIRAEEKPVRDYWVGYIAAKLAVANRPIK